MLTTIQPFKNAIAMACNSSILLPHPLSPTMTLRAVPDPSLELISSTSFPISTLSFLISAAGRLNKLQPCVVLKASTALNESTTGPGRPTTCFSSSALAMFSAAMSCKPGTSSAFVLLRTIRFRSALRSPGAGRRPESLFTVFLSWNALSPRFGGPPTVVFFFAGMGSETGAVVEKAAVRTGRDSGRHDAGQRVLSRAV